MTEISAADLHALVAIGDRERAVEDWVNAAARVIVSELGFAWDDLSPASGFATMELSHQDLLRTARALLSLPLPVASAWQGIDTAPRDGTRILCCLADRFPKNTYVVRWLDGHWKIGPMQDWIAYPTHWQPLPAPPGEKS